MRKTGIAAFALLPLCLGCASSLTSVHSSNAPSKPAVEFPSREQVQRIPPKKARPEAFRADEVAVDTWTFDSLPAGDDAPYEDASPWGDLMRELASAHKSRLALSAPLRCAAQEMARFYLKNHAPPAENLRRFMAARCGVVQTRVAPAASLTPVPAAVGDDELATHSRDMLRKLFEAELPPAGRALAGFAVARDANGAALVALVAPDDVRLQAGSRGVDANHRVTLRGAAQGEFTSIRALINRGDLGAQPCESDPGVQPPQFSVVCELAGGDRFAWVEVAAQRRGHFLAEALAETLVYEGDGKDLAYSARHVGPPAVVGSAAEFPNKMLERLNGVRLAAKLPPLSLATKQSAENARLVGTLIDAATDPGDMSDRAAVGLLAGWDVEGLIRTGHIFLSVAPSLDATAWLDAALERPMGRFALLDPDVRQIAVGADVADGKRALGAAVTTYAFFESDDHHADADRFFARIAAARAQRGLPAPERLAGTETTQAEAARVLRGNKPPMAALDDMMADVSRRYSIGVRGYVLEASDLERPDVPAAFLARGPMRVLLVVTHHRAPDAAWGQFVVFAVVLGGGAPAQQEADATDHVVRL
jgi:hypothetical protein